MSAFDTPLNPEGLYHKSVKKDIDARESCIDESLIAQTFGEREIFCLRNICR